MDNWFPHLLVLAGFGLHISEYVYIVISSCFDSRHFYGLLYLQMRLSSLHPYPWAPWRAFSLLVSSWSRGVYHDEVCASLWKSRSARCQFPVQFCLFIYALELMLFFFICKEFVSWFFIWSTLNLVMVLSNVLTLSYLILAPFSPGLFQTAPFTLWDHFAGAPGRTSPWMSPAPWWLSTQPLGQHGFLKGVP
jgi:hypothetical protein